MPVRSPRSSWGASSNLKYSPPSSVMCTRPSTYIASSVTKMPKLVTALTTPLYSSPRCSRMYLHLSQASTSRLASSARRSLALQCRPAACQARPARPSACWRGLLPGAASRLASLACASPGAGSAGNWDCVLPKMALMTRCTTRAGERRVARDGAGEMCVGIERQAKVAAVDGRVDRLLHRAQQHHVDLRGVWPILGGLGNRLELRRLALIADRQAHRHGLEVVAQEHLLFRRGAFVHAKQPGLAALDDEIGAADIGRQHRLFDQPVRIVADARHDLFDAPVLVADDLRLGGLEIHRPALAPGQQQRVVDIVQVQQILDPLLALGGFRPARVGQNGGDLGV